MTAVPVRPAAYIRDARADPGDESSTTEYRSMIVGRARHLGWPAPVVYADAGPAGRAAGSGRQYAALVDAIAAGRHDAVIVPGPGVIGRDLAQIEAADRRCRQHGVLLCCRYGEKVTSPHLLFDVIRDIRRFTVTDEHLRLLRRAHVSWVDAEFGAPGAVRTPV
jgi:hypothetical protein